MTITCEQYFGAKPHTPEQEAAAQALLDRVNPLLDEYHATTATGPDIDPDTGTEISGSKGGSGDGGFRLPSATTGSEKSKHKRARAVDASDQHDGLDEWLDQFEYGNGKNTMLEKYGLHRESPASTPTWCHLQDVPPSSGKNTYNP